MCAPMDECHCRGMILIGEWALFGFVLLTIWFLDCFQ